MSCDSAAGPSGSRRLPSAGRFFLLALLLLPAGCSRGAGPPPAEGYWYPEEILSPAERRDESNAKIARLTQWLRQRGQGGVLISTRANFAWVTAGGDGGMRDVGCGKRAARLFFGSDGRRVLIAPRAEALRLQQEELADVQYELHEAPPCGPTGGENTAAQLARGKPFVSDDAGGPDSAALAALRVPLAGSEIGKYRWLGKRCADVLDRVCRDIRPGMTERGIQALLSDGLMRNAITPLRIHVAAGGRAAKYGVAPPSEKTKVEEAVLAGFAASRWGLVIAISRSVHFGPLPEDSRKASEAVSAVTAGLWARTLPGSPAASILAAVAGDYERHGFPQGWMWTLTGGAVGYGREWLACAGSQEVVRSGQAFAWRAFVSPVASEDTILVVGDQLEVLTQIRGWPVTESRSLGRVYRTPAVLVR